MSQNGWIGVDLDGTLAQYDGWKGAANIGPPIAAMAERVKHWLAEGREIRIFTARVYPLGIDVVAPVERFVDAHAAREAIVKWCKEHIGQELPVTCVKDYAMVELWDDRAVRVVANTGLRCCEASE